MPEIRLFARATDSDDDEPPESTSIVGRKCKDIY